MCTDRRPLERRARVGSIILFFSLGETFMNSDDITPEKVVELIESFRALDSDSPLELGDAFESFRRASTRLVVGTDREIGRAEGYPEQRVAFTAPQVSAMIEGFERADVDVDLDVRVVDDAGAKAGQPNSVYLEAGAEIVSKDAIHEMPFDVFVALKEPSGYEGARPGLDRPFFRIGALHTGKESNDLRNLLRHKRAAILDGSSIGYPDDGEIPIRGAMSEFAGTIGAEQVAEHVHDEDLVGARGPDSPAAVVVGGGRAGLAAVDVLREAGLEVHLCEQPHQKEKVERLRDEGRIADYHFTGPEARTVGDVLAEIGDRVVGFVLAVAQPEEAAPKVVEAREIFEHTHPESMTVDISIDEGGAIGVAEADGGPTGETSEQIEWFQDYFQREGGGRHYWVEPNIPRARPDTASQRHGETMWRYSTALLLLSLATPDNETAVEQLADLTPRRTRRETTDDWTPAEQLLQQLRNGLAFWRQPGSGYLEYDPYVVRQPDAKIDQLREEM